MPTEDRLRGDDGVTLVETLIAMFVFTILLAMVGTATVAVLRGQSVTEGRSDRLAQARLALADIDRQVRSGNVLYPPVSPYRSVLVYTQANGQQKCVHWQLVNDSAIAGESLLQTRSWDPEWSVTGNYTTWRTVAIHLKVNSSDTPFVVPTGNPYNSRMLNVMLTVANADQTGQPVSAVTSVTGRNTEYGYNTQACDNPPPS